MAFEETRRVAGHAIQGSYLLHEPAMIFLETNIEGQATLMLQSEATEADTFINAISARLRLHEQCFAEHDATPLADDFIAPEAVWDFQGFPFLQGREAILAFFTEVVQTSSVAIKPIKWRSDGAMGWSLVDYVVIVENLGPPMPLRTMFIWSRSSGGWLVEAAVGYKI